MISLDDLARQIPAAGWSLEDFVAIANVVLPDFLPTAEGRPGAAGKVRAEVNVRLVRHYASSGLLDENAREGREARYSFRHLLQLLLVRRLLTEGYPAAVIAKLIAGKADTELSALLRGGASVSATPANPALDFLAGVRRRAALPPTAAPPSHPPIAVPPPTGVPPAAASTGAWDRLELLPGLEVHVRAGFHLPSSPHERARLGQLFLDALQALTRSSASPRRPRSDKSS
jgi:DNA-binding transcriptional MerR regulator